MRIINSKGEYETRSAEPIIQGYLKALGVSWKNFWTHLDIKKARTVFLMAIRDFREGRITLDDLATIANDLYYSSKGWSPLGIDRTDGHFGTVLGHASELAYYNWRKDEDPKTKKTLDSYLHSVIGYYEENKGILARFN